METSPSLQSQGNQEAGANTPPASLPLEKKHDELDILKGCPRTIAINGLQYEARAFKNDEFSTIGLILLGYGFLSCKNEQEVAEASIEEIYTNLVLLGSSVINEAGYASIQDFLCGFFKPMGHAFEILVEDTEDSKFREMLAILIEQNNLLSYAKKNAARIIMGARQT